MVKRRFMGTILAVVMAFASIGNFYNISKADENVTGQEKRSGNEARDLKVSEGNYIDTNDLKMIPEIKDLSRKEQSVVNKAVEKATQSGETAGKILNKLDEESDAIDVGVKEVLDTYFSEKVVDEEKVEEFDATLNIDIKDKIEAYKVAREERDNDKNLGYVTGEELVIFDKDTSKGEIDAIVSGISDSYEIIFDNDFEIDETGRERKKERLRALENYETDIVVKVNLDLDQTVESAAKEFEQFECVIEAAE